MLDRLILSQGFALIASSEVGGGTVEDFGSESAAKHYVRDRGSAVGRFRAQLHAGADVLVCGGFPIQVTRLTRGGLPAALVEQIVARNVAAAREAIGAFAESPILGRQPPGLAGGTGSIDATGFNRRVGGRIASSDREIRRFHEPSFGLFGHLGVELVASQVGSLREAMVLADLLEDRGTLKGYFPFSCRDDRSIADGTSIEECLAQVHGARGVIAVGFSQVPPSGVHAVLRRGKASTDLPLVIGVDGGLEEVSRLPDLTTVLAGWLAGGARGLGPCSGDDPTVIRLLRDALAQRPRPAESQGFAAS